MNPALSVTMTYRTLVQKSNFKQGKLMHVLLISGTDDHCANT